MLSSTLASAIILRAGARVDPMKSVVRQGRSVNPGLRLKFIIKCSVSGK